MKREIIYLSIVDLILMFLFLDILILYLSFVKFDFGILPWVILRKKGQHYMPTKGSLILQNIYSEYYLFILHHGYC
jgi:hypothetical protein